MFLISILAQAFRGETKNHKNMRNTLKKISCLIVLLIIASCSNEGGDDQPNLSPQNLNGLRLTLVEGSNTNHWVFGPDAGNMGQALLEGVGSFGFNFSVTGPNTTTLIFQVGGEDRYDMTWTSESGGTFEQSFNGGGGNSGSFSVEEAPEAPSSVSFLSLEQKFDGSIIQPKVTLTGALAGDFEVLDAGYWESGNSIKFINGIISLRYTGSNSVNPTAVVVRLKDAQGNDIGLKIPTVSSISETQYQLIGGSTFLRNVAPLSFSFVQEVDLGGGISVSSTVNAPNNNIYAQGQSGRDIVNLIQILRQGSGRDFPGNFADLAEIELSYFVQTEDINSSNAFVIQRYFDNNGSAVSQPTGNLEITMQTLKNGHSKLPTHQMTVLPVVLTFCFNLTEPELPLNKKQI